MIIIIIIIYVAKIKVLVSCAVIAQLICTFVFAYAKSMFSHGTAQLKSVLLCVANSCIMLEANPGLRNRGDVPVVKKTTI